jgi:hypothetical protein
VCARTAELEATAAASLRVDARVDPRASDAGDRETPSHSSRASRRVGGPVPALRQSLKAASAGFGHGAMAGPAVSRFL